MDATVFRTHDRGIRLPRPQPGVPGELMLKSVVDGDQRHMRASLLSSNGNLLVPELRYARVDRISSNGIAITGVEIVPRRATRKSSSDQYQQLWWCLVHTVWLADLLDVADMGEFYANLPSAAP